MYTAAGSKSYLHFVLRQYQLNVAFIARHQMYTQLFIFRLNTETTLCPLRVNMTI